MTTDTYDPDRDVGPPATKPLEGRAYTRPYTWPAGRYVAGERIVTAVNTALITGRPLLVTGEPGVGKTALAASVAASLRRHLYVFVARSDTRASDALYQFDHLRRLYDAQHGTDEHLDALRYRTFRELGTALQMDDAVMLIDEIDKATSDFPNDLLWTFERREFVVPETDERITAKGRPFLIVTSNEERDLPEPFLRRCIFLRIPFPRTEELGRIVAAHFPAERTPRVTPELRDAAVARFEALRGSRTEAWRKLPSTAELLDWVRCLAARGVGPADVAKRPWSALFAEALVKSQEDWSRVVDGDALAPR